MPLCVDFEAGCPRTQFLFFSESAILVPDPLIFLEQNFDLPLPLVLFSISYSPPFFFFEILKRFRRNPSSCPSLIR